jgi:hypothetical protein
MRVEAAPHVFRNEDRRQRFEERRGTGEDRRYDSQREAPRAKHEAHLWFAPVFGAHLLGQVSPAKATPKQARRAYQQPEANTPLRPEFSKSV